MQGRKVCLWSLGFFENRLVTLSGGSSLGETGCVLTEYNCSGVIVPSTVYEAVKRGCTRDCSFYGADTRTFMCGTMPVSVEEHALVLGGCTQYCLGGAVEMSGGASSSGVGGALTLLGGSSSGESEMSRGSDVERARRSVRARRGRQRACELRLQRDMHERIRARADADVSGTSGPVTVETGSLNLKILLLFTIFSN